jgi:hypothetical protein
VTKRIFIIHGRNLAARDELVKFIESLGLKHLSFESVANGMKTPAPFIADIVMSGISKADAVIALFTPDEIGAFYSLNTGQLEASRWQARPNVIFEAGVAYGLASAQKGAKAKKTILVTIGADVELFSDVSGVHFVRLDGAAGKEALRERLSRVLGALPRPTREWLDPPNSGDFAACLTPRWQYHDELDDLAQELGRRRIGREKKRVSLLEVLLAVVNKCRDADLSATTSKDIMRLVAATFSPLVTEDTYWWFCVFGIFQFTGIGRWWLRRHPPTWKDSVDQTTLSTRGRMLMSKLRIVAPPR